MNDVNFTEKFYDLYKLRTPEIGDLVLDITSMIQVDSTQNIVDTIVFSYQIPNTKKLVITGYSFVLLGGDPTNVYISAYIGNRLLVNFVNLIANPMIFDSVGDGAAYFDVAKKGELFKLQVSSNGQSCDLFVRLKAILKNVEAFR